MIATCMVQEGKVSGEQREVLGDRLLQIRENLAEKADGDFSIRWVEVPAGCWYTAGAPSSSSVITAIVPDAITDEQRVRVLEGICEAWTDVTGCSKNEVVAAAVNASYSLQLDKPE